MLHCKKPLFLILLAIGLLPGCRSIQETTTVEIPAEKSLYRELAPVASTLTILDNLEAQERIIRTFAKAYPGKIGGVEFLNNDWTMLVNGRRFYFANGRFLPEELRDQWEKYSPWDFYMYPWVGTVEERRAALQYPVYSVGSPYLFDTLYFSPTIDASWEMQVKYSFLGVKMLVHSYIAPKLDRVSARIRTAALSDPSIDEWIAELRTSPPSFGWNWRNIAGTNRRSMHSYGIAMDLLPRNLRGRLTYWQWGASDTVSPETHYLPPDAVIAAFQNYGFIWGGNWDMFDTMHFEFRPEILLLNNIQFER